MDLDAIDRLVAERVMGWHQGKVPNGLWYGGTYDAWVDDDDAYKDLLGVFRPTRDWNAAGLVFEKCKEWMWLCYFSSVKRYCAGAFEWVCFVNPHMDGITPQLAICLAALKKAGVKVE